MLYCRVSCVLSVACIWCGFHVLCSGVLWYAVCVMSLVLHGMCIACHAYGDEPGVLHVQCHVCVLCGMCGLWLLCVVK